MHEASIAQSLVRILEAEIAARALTTPIEKVLVKAGKFNAIIEDSLSFHFDILKEPVPLLRTCTLAVESIPLTAHCPTCGKDVTIDNPHFICEVCETPLTPPAPGAGKELFIDEITVQSLP